MSDLLPYIEPGGDSSNDGSNDEGIKDQYNPDYQGQEEVFLVPRRNPRRLKRGDQRAVIQI